MSRSNDLASNEVPPVSTAPADPVITITKDVSSVETMAPTKSRRPKAIGLSVLVSLALVLAWYVAADQIAPSSSTGYVTAATAQIAPRVSGVVTQVLVSDNQTVTSGTPLFILDSRPFDLAVAQAEANLDAAVQGVAEFSAAISSAQAKVTQAEATLENTQASVSRTQSLVERGISSTAMGDLAVSQLKNSEAALTAARADLQSAVAKAGGGEGNVPPQVQLAQVQLEQAQLNRNFSVVTAPTDGVITNLRLAVGQYINAGSPGLTFISNTTPWILVDMRENQIGSIDKDDLATLVFDAAPGSVFSGRVQGIAWGIDTGRISANGLPQNQSTTRWFEPARTIPVHIEIVDPEWPSAVRVGSKVNAVVYAGGRNNPISWIAAGLQTIQSFLSYIY